MFLKVLAHTPDLYVLRHGKPDNGGGLFPFADVPLSALGREQAFRSGVSMAKRGIFPEAIYASPLLRSRETADLFLQGYRTVSAELSSLVEYVDFLAELNVGSEPSALDVLRALARLNIKHENIMDVFSRIKSNLPAKIGNHQGPVLIFGHQYSNSCIDSFLTGSRPRIIKKPIPHLGVMHFSYNNSQEKWLSDKNFARNRVLYEDLGPPSFL